MKSKVLVFCCALTVVSSPLSQQDRCSIKSSQARDLVADLDELGNSAVNQTWYGIELSNSRAGTSGNVSSVEEGEAQYKAAIRKFTLLRVELRERLQSIENSCKQVLR